MKITSDWHIHSRNSCDQACMTVETLVAGAKDRGIRRFGLSDHIHTPYNLPDLRASRAEYLSVDPSLDFHFGVEASSVSKWEVDEIGKGGYDAPVYGIRKGGPPGGALTLGLTGEDVEELGIEYMIGGTHWPMYVPYERYAVIADYHRQNLFLAVHPLVDIVAHPWWWMGHWADGEGRFTAEPWFDDFGRIPKSMHDEFAAACVENRTMVEVNISAMLLNPRYPEGFVRQYLDYLTDLRERGASFTIGSDCHSARYDSDFESASVLLESAGFSDGDFQKLPGRTAR